MVVDCVELETELPECSQYASIKCLPNSAFFQTIFDGSWTILRFCHVHRKAKIGQKLKSAPSHQEPRTSQSSSAGPGLSIYLPSLILLGSKFPSYLPSWKFHVGEATSAGPNGTPPLGASYAQANPSMSSVPSPRRPYSRRATAPARSHFRARGRG